MKLHQTIIIATLSMTSSLMACKIAPDFVITKRMGINILPKADITSQTTTRHIKDIAPTRNNIWHEEGLSLTVDNEVLGNDIVAYRIKWFSGKWSQWYVPGVNDIDAKINEGADRSRPHLRRMWSCFADHTHEYIILHKPTPKKEVKKADSPGPSVSAFKAKLGSDYQVRLINAVDSSDQIIIKEHSNRSDFDGVAPKNDVIYKGVVLNSVQTAQFLADLKSMSPAPKMDFSRCEFVPHHTIEFYQNSKLTSSMKICYQCDDTGWDQWKKKEGIPAAIQATIAKTLKRLGMEPKRDWKTLARGNQ